MASFDREIRIKFLATLKLSHNTWHTRDRRIHQIAPKTFNIRSVSEQLIPPISFSSFPSCLSKLPIQVPYKFRVESPASIIIITITCTSGVDKVNDIECFLPHT